MIQQKPPNTVIGSSTIEQFGNKHTGQSGKRKIIIILLPNMSGALTFSLISKWRGSDHLRNVSVYFQSERLTASSHFIYVMSLWAQISGVNFVRSSL